MVTVSRFFFLAAQDTPSISGIYFDNDPIAFVSGGDESPNPSTGSGSLLSGRRKWAGVGAIVLVVAIVGLGLTLFLDGAGVTPVVAIVIAVIGGAAIAIWLVEAQP